MAENTIRGLRHKVPGKVHGKPTSAPPKGRVHVKPRAVDPKAGRQNLEALKKARQSSQNLRGMGADSVASAAKAVRAHAGRFATSVAGFGGQAITTAAAALDVLVKMYAEAPSKAAAELQLMAKSGLIPNKGSENT